MHTYDAAFYNYINRGSANSAKVILPIIQRFLPGINSVADFGCGQGAWLAVWRELGVSTLQGLDGQYVDTKSLLINSTEFLSHDLTKFINLDRSFDIVQSLEVAEHLPDSKADDFVRTLTKHGKVVVFAAAVPGQGGENHINEQPYEYWRDLFKKYGYEAFDPVRPFIIDNKDVMQWYKYNTLIYIHDSIIGSLSEELQKYQVGKNSRIKDVSPLFYKIRKQILKPLPVKVYTWFAHIKKWYVNLTR